MDAESFAAVEAAIEALAARYALVGVACAVEGWGRDAEHTAGRRAANTALARAGSVDTAVGGAPGSAPQWPAGWVGSISHTADVAVAVVRSPDVLVGVDVEHAGALPERDAEFVMNPAERDGRATLRWSAKESAYKAWSRLGIDPVDPLHIHTEIRGDALTAEGLGPALHGGWCDVAGFVITLLVSASTPSH